MRIERRGHVKPLTPRFTQFLCERLGGIPLDDIQAPNERRTDYACLRGLLAVEVKTLEDDASERLSHVTDELSKREDWPVFYGTWPIGSVIGNLQDPEPVKRKVAERISTAIVRHLKKANKQLAAHSTTFPRRNLVRLVAFLNEDHKVYDPAMFAYLIQHELARLENDQPKYANIDAVLYLSERHAMEISGNVTFPLIIISGRPIDGAAWKHDVLDFVAAKWSGWTGARHFVSEAETVRSFETIEHIPERMRRQELWQLQYRRNPYMRTWSSDQLRDRWDDLIVRSLFTFLKDPPLRLPKEVTARDMEHFTHLLEEIAHRGLPMPMFKAEADRFLAAATRLQLPAAGIAWVRAQFEAKPMAI